MRKSFFLIGLLFLLVLNSFNIVSAGVDQENTDETSEFNTSYIDWSTKQAQSFQPTQSILTGISLRLRTRTAGDPSGDLSVRIMENNPDGDVIKTWAISPADVTIDFAWIRLNCTNLLDLSKTYYIVLTATTTDPVFSTYVWATGEADPYSQGSLYKKSVIWPWPTIWGDWENQSGIDACFKTWCPNVDPVADFTFNDIAPLIISFDGSSSSDSDGSIVSYEWDWDSDGTYDTTGMQPSHEFPNYGNYNVKLRVTDNEGGTDIVSNWVNFNNNPPVAVIGDVGGSDLNVIVDGYDSSDSDGSIVSYEWDFNDDDVYDDTGIESSYTYGSNGTYLIRLRVTDDVGSTDTDTTSVTVSVGTTPDENPDPGSGDSGSSGFLSGDWFTLLLNLPTYVILLVVAIIFIMVAATAFFMKPEIINVLGVVPAVSSLIVGILAVIAVVVWYSEMEIYYLIGCVVGIVGILALDIKYFTGRK